MAGRFKDGEWNLAGQDGRIETWERVIVAVLMDLRDELKSINATLKCGSTQMIPNLLGKIARNTTKPRRKRVKA